MNNISIHNETVVPSIDAVELTYKQIFPAEGVTKNLITFNREEDMIVMCLSTFVHDYVHDYNLGSMHARVIKGNINRIDPDTPSLFETLGINIGNTIFKIMAYPTGGHRDISMYNDEQFEDESTNDSKILDFYKYLNINEEQINKTSRGGEKMKPGSNTNKFLNKITEMEKPMMITEPITEKINEQNIEQDYSTREQIIEENLGEGLLEEDIPIKKITFDDVKDVLFIPSIFTGLESKLDIKSIINTFETNADFLDFCSGINTYIVTYLGYDVNKYDEFTSVSPDKNIVADQAIRASLKYIINDLKINSKNMYFNLFADIFSLYEDSYDIISKNYAEKNISSFDLLNSSEILYQFIIFYVSYISSENYDRFKELIGKEIQYGGENTDENEEIELEEDNPLEEGTSSQVSDFTSPSLPQPKKEIIEIPEYVFLTHNNLLTTITRGMFIKLGIWKRIFFPDTPINDIKPDDYKFGFEELNKITYDKLVEIYPVNPESGGHRNNELLILEILILKRLLIEMSPSKTLTFGAKIDDDLKNFMDTFYNNYFTTQNFIETKILPITEDNPDIYGSEIDENMRKNMEQEAEELFAMCEEGCEDFEQDSSATSDFMMEGGMKYEDRMAMIQAKKELEKNNDSITTSSVVENIQENVQPVIESVSSVVEEVKDTIDPIVNDIQEKVAPILPTSKNKDIDIIEMPRPPSIPILFNKLKKMYQNNMFVINQLKNSKIPPIEINGNTISNLYDLLELNVILMHKKGSKLNIPAPKYKFIINNAANVGSNLNGSRMFITRSFLDAIETTINEIISSVFVDNVVDENKLTTETNSVETELDKEYQELEKTIESEIKELNSKKRAKIITIREYNNLLEKKYDQKVFERTKIVPLENKLFLLEILKQNPSFFEDFKNNFKIWFRDSQPFFGLYRSLQRGIFCPTSSMMDAMDNCSLKYKTTEPKEVGTSYSEIRYKNEETGKEISFGGVVLNYNQVVDGNKELTAKIYYNLICNVGASVEQNDTMTISTLPIKVSESNDLKARVAYRGVVNMMKEIYDFTNSTESNELGSSSESETQVNNKLDGVEYIQQMWKRMQYQYDQNGFNMLLSATALKTMGDYLQECQACFKWGGYISKIDSSRDNLLKKLNSYRFFQQIQKRLIYRSVNKGGAIIPYDKNGNALRLGIQGDRPSGFRSIYMLLNGEGDVNQQAITGYMFTSSTQNPSRTLLVARNEGEENSYGLKGSVIYVTRELQVPDKDALLRSLEFLNVKNKNRKVEGEIVSPEIIDTTIPGSEDIRGDELLQNPMTKIQPLKNSAYEGQLDYNDTEFIPDQPQIEVEQEKTDAEEAREQRKNKFKELKGLDPSLKLAKQMAKEKEKAEKQAEKEREKTAKLEEASRKRAEKEQKEIKINDAKRKINNLRTDLSVKQKSSKSIPKIPLNFLQSINALELGIDQEIYNLILNEAEEDKRISDLADKQLAEKAAEKAKKAAEKAAYEASPEGLAEKAAREEERLEKLRQEEEMRSKELREMEIKKQEEIEQREKRKLEIPLEVEKLREELAKTSEKSIKAKINKQINSLESELRNLSRRRGGTLSNKREHIYKKTKRQNNKGNKLTKKYKKSKIPRKTRKNI